MTRTMSDDECGCCEGIGVETPAPLANPPGRPALSYRVGTHGSFFRTMLARLSALQAEHGLIGGEPAREGAAGCLGETHRSFLLGSEPDAGTALLDGWACIADVLTFYQERIANEGYLRTATEQRSVIELGRLTGYEPRPGVAASAHLAFTVQDGFDGVIPARTRTQSMPRPGQTAQVFETSQPIGARAEWNAMRAGDRATGRYIRREYIARQKGPKETRRIEIFLEGVGQNVQAGDVLLVEVPGPAKATRSAGAPRARNVYRITNAWPAPEHGHTTLRLVPIDGNWLRGGEWDTQDERRALEPAAVPIRPAATASLARARRTLDQLLGAARTRAAEGSDARSALEAIAPDTLLALGGPGRPELREHLRALLRTLEPEPPPRVHVMRTRAQVFGHAAPPITEVIVASREDGDGGVSKTVPREHDAATDERRDVVYLAGELAAIRAGTTVVIRAPRLPKEPQPGDPTTPTADTGDLATYVLTASAVDVQSRLAYGTPGKTTRIALSGPWWEPFRSDITPIRRALVYAQPEPLVLVGEPLSQPISGSTIDLDRVVEDLPADRLLIIEGQQDLPGTTGSHVAELVRVAATSTSLTTRPVARRLEAPRAPGGELEVPPEPPGRARPYTTITLTAPLRHRYRRATVVIHGNVVHATHGETRDEILGSGDASVAEQRFTLRQGPRTWESAPTTTGVASSLAVRVSGVLWPEVPSFALPGPRDEVVRTRVLGDGRDEVRGGDGRRGARFPTGIENITARYRVGLGAAGNVDRGLITALVTRPMGVREVVNPRPASGGADADGRDEIRQRIPIAARGIDRLVSVADHADFALNFAGVDKAAARHAAAVDGPGAGGATIEVVIAGAEDMPIEDDADLLHNLRAAFRRYGDPLLRPVVRVATAVPLVLQANVRLDPRHDWPGVEAALRERLYLRYGWNARALGEDAHLSGVLAALQAVAGVRSIDVDVFGPLRSAEPRPVPGPAPGPKVPAAFEDLLVERVRGLRERLLERGGELRWAFPAAPHEILYFARSAPTNVVFSEVAP
jgi:predicted phage baseplate assembly protein